MNFEYRKTKVVGAEVKEITPQLASTMLEKNVGNRTLSPAIVREYAAYIRDGLWQENGQAIQVTEDGFVVDGQHRLNAVVLAKKPITTLVVTIAATDDEGALDAIGMAIDRNKPRRHTDISGIDPRGDQVSALMIREFMPEGTMKSKNTALRASVYFDLQDPIDQVIARASVSVRLYSRASIRAALALRHHQGYDEIHHYTNALKMNMKELPDVWVSWWRQVAQIEGNNRDSRRKLLSLTWDVTNPGKPERTRLTMRTESVERNIAEMTDVFYDACLSTIVGVEKNIGTVKRKDGTLTFDRRTA